MRSRHRERHRTERIGWLRASVLGANDGIVSTASLVVGVAASGAARGPIRVAGMAGLVAGAMSMAAGEYVSVSSQADADQADLDRERSEIEASPDAEHNELAGIYVERGLDETLAHQVARQLMAHDALGAHARDELGITVRSSARPLQAAFASALSFAVGAALPLASATLGAQGRVGTVVAASSLLLLGLLGAVAARVGGASPVAGAGRVLLWGAIAMGTTAGVGLLLRTPV
jgi:VIT1/CCC1 family predicted Fe2+/Mn2+ transporter